MTNTSPVVVPTRAAKVIPVICIRVFSLQSSFRAVVTGGFGEFNSMTDCTGRCPCLRLPSGIISCKVNQSIDKDLACSRRLVL